MLNRGEHNTLAVALAALALVCVTLVASTLWMTFGLDTGAAAINIAGRQRMLSQRITKNLLIAHDTHRPLDLEVSRVQQELFESADLFDATLRAFRDGGTIPSPRGEMIQLASLDTPAGRLVIDNAMETWRPLYRDIKHYKRGGMEAERALLAASQAALLGNEQLLQLMDRLTEHIEQSFQHISGAIRSIQTAAMFVAVLVFAVVLHQHQRQLTVARRNQNFLNDVLNSLDECVLLCTEDGFIINCNLQAETLFQYKREELLAINSKELIKSATDSEQKGCRQDGELFYIRTNSHPMYIDGHQVHLLTVHDISEQKKSENALREMAYYDPLTKLPNRALIRDRIEHEIAVAKRQKYRFALLFIDLDNFKWVNDNCGHDVGDAMLVEVAHQLRGAVRQSDTVGRLGGDELVALFTRVDDKKICERLANNIIRAISSIESVAGIQVAGKVGASIGISYYPDNGENVDELLSSADEAMYQAKTSGGGSVHWALSPLARTKA